MSKKIFSAGLIFLILGFFTLVRAQNNDQNEAQEGVTVSPPLVEINLDPGNKYTEKIKVTNPTNNLVELYPVAMNFSAKDETGSPGFATAEEDSSTFAMAKWIKFPQSKIALTSQQVIDFSYTIDVPADAEPGGHYGVIFFGSQPPTLSGESSQVAIASRVGVLVLGKVAGEISESSSVEEFSANKKFFLKTPVDFFARIRNNGNIHLKPSGNIIIKNIFGKEIGKIAVNEQNGNVLPESIRRFEQKWEPSVSPFYKIPVGRFTANLALTYGENNQALNSQISFWIIPIWFIIALGIVVLLIIFLIFLNKRKKSFGKIAEGKQKEADTDEKEEIEE